MKKEQEKSNRIDYLKYKNLTRSIPASIRFITKRDFKQIAEIERNSFENPLKCNFRLKLRAGATCYVVEHNGFIVAYAILQYKSNHCELCSLAVDKNYRRRKIASLIINMLKIKLQLEKKNCIVAYVSEHNPITQLFLRKSGFIVGRVLHDYYSHSHHAYRYDLIIK